MSKSQDRIKKYLALLDKKDAGTATEDEVAEMGSLRKLIDAPAVTASTELVTMTVEEFKAHSDKELDELEKNYDADRHAALQKSLKAAEGKADDETIPVEVVCKADGNAAVVALEARIAGLEAKLAGLDKGEGDDDGDDKGALKKADMPIAVALAKEALQSYIDKLSLLMKKVETGSITKDDFDNAFDNSWTLQDMIRGAAAVLQKSEKAPDDDSVKRCVEYFLAKADDESGEGEEGDGGEGDDGDGEGEGLEKGKGEGDPDTDDSWPDDIASEPMSGNEMYKAAKKSAQLTVVEE